MSVPSEYVLKALKDLQEDIQGLNLDKLEDTHVVICPIPEDESSDLVPGLPAIVLCPFGSEVIQTLTNASDLIQVPLLVAVLESSGVVEEDDNPKEKVSEYLHWRQSIIDNQLHNRTTTNFSAADVLDRTIEPNGMINVQGYLQQDTLISSFIVRVHLCVARRT